MLLERAVNVFFVMKKQTHSRCGSMLNPIKCQSLQNRMLDKPQTKHNKTMVHHIISYHIHFFVIIGSIVWSYDPLGPIPTVSGSSSHKSRWSGGRICRWSQVYMRSIIWVCLRWFPQMSMFYHRFCMFLYCWYKRLILLKGMFSVSHLCTKPGVWSIPSSRPLDGIWPLCIHAYPIWFLAKIGEGQNVHLKMQHGPSP